MEKQSIILNNISAYKKKHYKGLLLKGLLLTLFSLLILFSLGGVLEYFFWFNPITRKLLFLTIVSSSLFIIYKSIIIPFLLLNDKRKGISDEKAAQEIGKFYKEIDDKLVNFLQLNNNKEKNLLTSASINQRSETIDPFIFSNAITIQDYLKIVPYLATVFLLIITISFWKPSLLIESTQRIANFNKNYSPPALFSFSVQNSALKGYKNENFTLSVQTFGTVLPKDIYLILSNRRKKMTPTGNGTFNYEFLNIQSSQSFYLESAGVKSADYLLDIQERPSLKGFFTHITYPAYITRPKETFNSIGNLTVPKGSSINWEIQSISTDSVFLAFNKTTMPIVSKRSDYQLFTADIIANQSDDYEMIFVNSFGKNKENILYSLEVIEDEFPQISLEHYQDTTLYSYIILNGKISDDYGLKKLALFYKTQNTDSYKSIPLTIETRPEQTYYHKWIIDTLLTNEANKLTYYLEVWDNDAINGFKSTRSVSSSFKLPEKEVLKKLISKSDQATKKEINNSLKQANELEKSIKELEESLKGKKELTWQDKNKIKEIIDKKNLINKAIDKLKEQNKKSNLQKDHFSEQEKRIKEKAKQLQKLMNSLLDEETKKLYEELQKLLEENKDINKIQKTLNKLDNKEKNLEKELERALELFKRLALAQKKEDTIAKLEDLSKKQEELSAETKAKENTIEEISKKQEEINKSTDDIEKNIEELNKLNQDLKSPTSIPDFEEEMDEIKKVDKKVQEELEKGKRKKSSELQKDAAQKMQALANKMKKMQSGLEAIQENLDDLRDILHGLIKLSFDQESLMVNFGATQQSDPKFVVLSQAQIKLKSDAKILEDSLLSLANRVFQISSFVTREVADMNQYMDESSIAIRERQKEQIVGKQQFAMTSMNNLALLLDEVLQQIQQQMADAMGNPQPGDKKGKSELEMGKLQQELNKKIKALKNGSKQGRQLSEELAKLASEQERLRKMLKKFQDNANGNPQDNNAINKIINKMEETELDLVNKNITDKTIKRQEEILTRLLQSEDALREQEKEEERESEKANSYEDFLPKAFEEYFKTQEKKLELLKTIPPKLYPHYKNEVNNYFDRVNKNTNKQ